MPKTTKEIIKETHRVEGVGGMEIKGDNKKWYSEEELEEIKKELIATNLSMSHIKRIFERHK